MKFDQELEHWLAAAKRFALAAGHGEIDCNHLADAAAVLPGPLLRRLESDLPGIGELTTRGAGVPEVASEEKLPLGRPVAEWLRSARGGDGQVLAATLLERLGGEPAWVAAVATRLPFSGLAEAISCHDLYADAGVTVFQKRLEGNRLLAGFAQMEEEIMGFERIRLWFRGRLAATERAADFYPFDTPGFRDLVPSARGVYFALIASYLKNGALPVAILAAIDDPVAFPRNVKPLLKTISTLSSRGFVRPAGIPEEGRDPAYGIESLPDLREPVRLSNGAYADLVSAFSEDPPNSMELDYLGATAEWRRHSLFGESHA